MKLLPALFLSLLLTVHPGMLLAQEGNESLAHINGFDVRLREKPDANSKVHGLMELGTTVQVLEKKPGNITLSGKTGNWWKVRLKEPYIIFWQNEKMDSLDGWVFSVYVSEGEFTPDNMNKLELSPAVLESASAAGNEESQQQIKASFTEILLSHEWNGATRDQYVPCFSNGFSLTPKLLQLWFYDESEIYRITKWIETSPTSIELTANVIDDTAGYPGRNTPFPAKSNKIKITTESDYASIKVLRSGKTEQYEHSCSRGYVSIKGNNVNYRKVKWGGVWDFDGNYQALEVVGQGNTGDIIPVTFVEGGATINGIAGQWIESHQGQEENSFIVFSGYTQTPTVEQMFGFFDPGDMICPEDLCGPKGFKTTGGNTFSWNQKWFEFRIKNHSAFYFHPDEIQRDEQGAWEIAGSFLSWDPAYHEDLCVSRKHFIFTKKGDEWWISPKSPWDFYAFIAPGPWK